MLQKRLSSLACIENKTDKFIFPGGAAVAQLTVNQLVVGSNPARGANF